MEAGISHVMVPEEDCVTFECWDGDFIARDYEVILETYSSDRIGLDKLKKK